MRTAHKITLGTIGTTIAIIAGLFTIIEKTPSVVAVISSMTKAEASEAPDTLNMKRTMAGVVEEDNIQRKPKGAK